MRHDDLVDRSGGRHRMARHRAPSAFERRRYRTLDLLADVADALPSGRTLTTFAVGGVVVAAGLTAGAQAVGAGDSAAAVQPLSKTIGYTMTVNSAPPPADDKEKH